MKKHLRPLIMLFSISILLTSCEQPFDYNPNDIPFFAGLDAPAAGEGYQVHIEPFPVPANYEREFFLRVPVGNTEDIYVDKFTSLCRPGTHHLIAYGFEDENDGDLPPVGVMRDQNLPDGRGNLSLTMGSESFYYAAQTANFELEFPGGIAIKIPANASFDINSHYFNATEEMQFGEIYLNAHTIPRDSATETLVVDDINNDEVLFLPPNETVDIEYTETFSETSNIRMMFSHMHKRGIQFDVYKVGGNQDGELLYSAYDYQHPPYQLFDPAIVIEEGEGLRTVVRYANETNREISFGVTSEDEMGILFYFKNED